MALKIRQNGEVKDLIIPACGVEVLDMEDNFGSSNLEEVLQELGDSDSIYISDETPDKDGIWISSDNTSTVAQENPILVELKDYVDTNVTPKVNKNTNSISQLSNPNLLINGDFQVWQRGTSFTNVAVGNYQADRWMVVSTDGNYLATVTKVSDGLRIEQSDAGCVIRQYIEEDLYNKIKDKTLTMSKSVDGIITIDKIKPTNSNGKYFFEIGIGRNVTINWIKIEIGSVATPFVPRPYGEELALCQRYYERSNHMVRGLIGAELFRLSFDVQYKQTKRIAPTLKIYGSNNEEGVVMGKIGTPINFPVRIYRNDVDAFGCIDVIDNKGQNFVSGETFELAGWEADAEIY